MKKQEKPPKKKSQDREVDPSGKNRKTPAAPEAQERITEPDSRSKAETTPQPDTPSREEVIESWSKPVTNQDEQNKITNAGEGDIPIANM